MNEGGTPENLKPFKPGESGNPSGRPVGSRNRSTIARKWLELLGKHKNPLTEEETEITEEDLITLAQIKKAREGDTKAYQALMDSGYGAPKQPVEHSGDGVTFSLNLKGNEPLQPPG